MPIIKEKVKPNLKLNYNILDYIENQTDDFFKTPFNEVDSVILAQFTYVYLERFVSDLSQDKQWVKISSLYKAEFFKIMLDKTLYTTDNKSLLVKLCASPRFRDVEMNFYDSKLDIKTQEQFCAITYKLPSNEIVIGFRGTDSTVIGWKEDFNMLFLSPVPCQISAVNYLETVAEKTQNKIYITGHSKGGNLAVYSALFAKKEVRDRIIQVYDLDGPGFQSQVWKSHKLENEELESKITKIIPESSFFGVLLDSVIKAKKIKSSKKIGMLRHETYTWQIEGNQFIESEDLTSHAKYIDHVLDKMLSELDYAQREMVIETVFSIVEEMNVQEISDFIPLILKEKDVITRAISNVDEETEKYVKEIFKGLVKGYFNIGNKDADEKKESSKSSEERKALAIFNTVKVMFESREEIKKTEKGIIQANQDSMKDNEVIDKEKTNDEFIATTI